MIAGTPSLRTPKGERELAEGEVVAFPVGEEGAHQVVNRTDGPVRILIVSEMNAPDDRRPARVRQARAPSAVRPAATATGMHEASTCATALTAGTARSLPRPQPTHDRRAPRGRRRRHDGRRDRPARRASEGSRPASTTPIPRPSSAACSGCATPSPRAPRRGAGARTGGEAAARVTAVSGLEGWTAASSSSRRRPRTSS